MGDYMRQQVREADIHFIVNELIAHAHCVDNKEMLFGALQLPPWVEHDLKFNYRMEGSSYGYFKGIIASWIQLKGDEASTYAFDKALRKIDCNAVANSLRNNWFTEARPTAGPSTVRDAPNSILTGPTPSQHAKESKPHFPQMATSFITGATSVSNSNFNNCPVVGKQYNINSSDSNPAKKSIWFNTGEPIPSYTGREDKLNEVHKIFFPTNKEVKPIHQIAIVGLGGVGKSEFTRKFAWKYCIQLDGNAAWINSETVQLLIDSFKELATQIGVKFPELSGKAEILQMVDQVYAYFGEKKSLFIFDNVEDWVDGENAIKPYLPNRMGPGVEKPFVLMTSRSRPPGGIKLIELSVLKVAEAVNLIKARLDVQEVDCVELLVQLVNLLGCLPLALQQASSYIKQEMEADISGKHQNEMLASCIETYIKMFDDEAKKLLDYKPTEMDVDFEELKTTLLTWRITLEKIKDLNPNAKQLLELMSYISPDDIHLEMFEKQFTFDDLKDAVNTLVRFSMITRTSNIVSVHRLVQRVVGMDFKEKQEGTQGGENDEYISLESVLNLLNIILNELPDKIKPYSTSCVNHAQVAWEHALAYPELLKQFEDYPANLYKKAELHGMHTANLSLLHQTLSKYKLYSIYEESDGRYILIQHLIASALLELDKYDDAKSLYQIIHKTAAEKLGESHPLTLSILNCLAVAEDGLGNFSEQMTILDNVIAIRTATPNLGPYHKNTLASLHNKAAGFVRMGKYDEALELFKSTLELREKHNPEDRNSINSTRYMIATTTQKLGNFAEALPIFRNLHAERVESFGESHTDTLRCAREIGECLLKLGKYEEAMELLKYNLNLAINNPGARLQCANMRFSIARVLLKMKRYDEAVSQFIIVLEEESSIFGETHPEVLTTREWLADALKLAGRTEEALEHYKFVYDNRLKTLGAEHPDAIRVKEKMETILNNRHTRFQSPDFKKSRATCCTV